MRGVGHHHDGGSLLVQFGQQLHHFVAVVGVQVTRRLVGQDQPGVGHDRAGDGHPLLLSPAQLLGKVVASVHHVHPLQGRLSFLRAFVRGSAKVKQRQFHVFEHRKLVDQVKALEDKTDVALAKLGTLPFGFVGHLVVHEVVFSLRRIVQQSHDIQQGGFPASRRTHDRAEFARVDLQVHIVQGGGFHLFGRVGLLEIFGLDHDCWG